MKKTTIFISMITSALLFICSGFAYSGQKVKQEMPQKVLFGQWELNLLWQKDLSKFFGREVSLGSYGNLGPAISMSADGKYIGVDIHPWDRKTHSIPEDNKKGIFYLLNKEGKILWSKRLGVKQWGVVSKNGSTVLITVPRDELDIEFYIYDINGKQTGHGRQSSLLQLSGNGEYIVAFDQMAGHDAVLYDKKGRIVWKHEFDNPWGGGARIMDTGDVVLFDTENVLLKRPNGQVLWKWPNPTDTIWFDIPPDATADEPNIVTYSWSKDRMKDQIALINSRGNIIWQTTQMGAIVCYERFTISEGANFIAGHQSSFKESSLWVWSIARGKKVYNQALASTTECLSLNKGGDIFLAQGATLRGNLPGVKLGRNLYLVDLINNKTAQIPSNHFSLSTNGKHLAISNSHSTLTLYELNKK